LGRHLGISFTTVARIWRKWGIQPEHVEMFTFSADLKQQAQVRDLGGLYRNLSQRAAALHRPVPDSATEGQSADHPDPWLKLVEVSLGIITQQAIRHGTSASVRNLIDALGALAGSWQGRPEPSTRTDVDENAIETGVAKENRQNTSDTHDDPEKRSSRSGENGPPQAPYRPTGRARDSKSVRAEFHGTRGRRSGPTSGARG
jgi:hypothetical protein